MKISAFLTFLSLPCISALVQPTFVKPKTFIYAGDIAPMGYFDPLKITKNIKEDDVKYLREAELQHSRVAMLSFVSLVALDAFNDDLAINQLSNLNLEQQFPYWFGVFCAEFARMFVGWENPFVSEENKFSLKDSYQPGNIFGYSDDSYSIEMLNKELSNGRLAMLGTIGYMAQELVQHKAIL